MAHGEEAGGAVCAPGELCPAVKGTMSNLVALMTVTKKRWEGSPGPISCLDNRPYYAGHSRRPEVAGHAPSTMTQAGVWGQRGVRACRRN